MVGQACTRELTWDRGLRRLHGYSELFGGGFPERVRVTSHHTGRALWFRPVDATHALFDEDHWDGEQAIYACEEASVDVVLVLTHAY
jgi:hypothetical protein